MSNDQPLVIDSDFDESLTRLNRYKEFYDSVSREFSTFYDHVNKYARKHIQNLGISKDENQITIKFCNKMIYLKMTVGIDPKSKAMVGQIECFVEVSGEKKEPFLILSFNRKGASVNFSSPGNGQYSISTDNEAIVILFFVIEESLKA